MNFSLKKKSYKSHNSYKHLKKLSADKSNHGHEHLPILDSMRAVDLSDHPSHSHSHREEVIVKIYDGDSSATKASATTGAKIWRENSYEFWKDQAKSGFDFVRQGSGSGSGGGQNSNTVAAAEEEKDPPSKLIKQFLHKQEASGKMALDMDLEMDELRHENDRKLPPVSESPFKATPSRELRVSFQESEFSTPTPNKNNDSVRRRFSSDDNSNSNSNKNNYNNDGVTWTSNTSVQRKSRLLRAKNQSRLMDPPPAEMEKRSGREPGSGQVRSGMLKKMDDEDDDPFLEDDMPNEFRCGNVNAWTILQWLSLVVIIGALACTLGIHDLWHKNVWKLRLWKWEVLVLVLICGRLVSGWGIRIIVFFIERNFLLRKRVLYFIYGVRNPVQNCLWLGLVLMAWHFLFDKKVERETKSDKLKYFTKFLVCMLVGTFVWLVKTLVVKVLASSFHVSTYFDRIHESLFNQYVIETLSGPPLIEIQNAEDDEFNFVDEVRQLQNAGATMPPDLKASAPMPPDLKANAFPSMRSGRVIGSGGLQMSGNLSRTMSKKGDEGITIDLLHKLNPKNVSARNMKRLMRIVRHGTITTLDEQVLETTPSGDNDFSTQIRSEVEAKAAAKKIFQNVARHESKFIYMEDLMRFLKEDEAVKTLSLFEGASETRRISKSSLKNWVVNAFRDRRALTLTLNDTKTAVNKLHRVLNILVGLGIFVVWLLILGIATTKFLLYISSQLVLVAFIFGNTCKTVFEAIIFLFVMHPYDVGDRCEIEGVQMVVEEMNILTTVFLRYDNTKVIYPNSVLATKPINNFYRSPDMGDAIDFCVHIATPADKIAAMRQRIISYVESKEEHWCAAPMIVLMEFEELNRLRLALWLSHKMNYQDMGEKFVRRSLLMEEMAKIFRELDIQYRLLPVDINVCAMPPVISTQLPTTRVENTRLSEETGHGTAQNCIGKGGFKT
ncbi:mechanosensitive ion channel protein 6-like [Quercus robur]|uniref:mechanosensitive ion channel protein 6-like n=1 Tax=Quercus robur TaxID=38942 RepID=UPI0021635119|nr:mechanosensitive ion channel protein 6-like [Quercus robur]XP_050259492.1 mechanosensitive ion channel protein 6-like [Quercus robur]